MDLAGGFSDDARHLADHGYMLRERKARNVADCFQRSVRPKGELSAILGS